MSDPVAMLARELGVEMPSQFADLTADRLSWLLELVREQAAVQVAALDDSAETVLANLPALFRAPARALMGGSR